MWVYDRATGLIQPGMPCPPRYNLWMVHPLSTTLLKAGSQAWVNEIIHSEGPLLPLNRILSLILSPLGMDAWLVKAWFREHFPTTRSYNHKRSKKLLQGTQWKPLPPLNIHQTETQNKTDPVLVLLSFEKIFWDFIPREENVTCYKTEQYIHISLLEEPLAAEIGADGFYL